ncbi:MAG: hypothetical protein VCA35_15160, partial [Roseibacillus sp.]
ESRAPFAPVAEGALCGPRPSTFDLGPWASARCFAESSALRLAWNFSALFMLARDAFLGDRLPLFSGGFGARAITTGGHLGIRRKHHSH